MQEVVIVVLVVLALLVLARAVLSGRSGRDPASSVDSFHRALSAMEPGRDGTETGRSRVEDEPTVRGGETDQPAEREPR